MCMAAPGPMSLKRPSSVSSGEESASKKPRSAAVTITLKPKPRLFASAPIPMANASADFPNGFVYCHQCSKKRDVTDAIQCTFLEHVSPRPNPQDPPPHSEFSPPHSLHPPNPPPSHAQKSQKPPRNRRCVAKFCKFCLKNRYDQDFESLVAAVRAAQPDIAHVPGAGYIYKCPKCSNTCNCPRCRKSMGLPPMGSAGTIRRPPEPVPKPPKQNPDRKPKPKPTTAATSNSTPKTKKPKSKPLPVVKWTPVPVNLSLEDAEARFYIRESVLRFANLFEPPLPKVNLEELEEIGGGRHQGREEDGDMTSWVSEFCVKSIIVGLLNLIEKELHGALAASIKHAVKEIRLLGVNLNKIWPVLSSLRESSIALSHSPSESDLIAGLPPPSLPGSPSSTSFIFTFPDPLPPPTIHDIRAIRSTRNNDTNDGLHIAYSAQMVPIITSLIEDALLTGAIRDEIENGVREGKETVKEQREAIKKEAERWEQVRKGMETHVKLKAQILENRAKREYHKRKVASLDNSLKVLTPTYLPRLTPLGMDSDSRVYWILSPGVSEREAASDFIMSCSRGEKAMKGRGKKNAAKKPPKAKALGNEERKEMKTWSWFLAVWGRRPEDAAGSRKGKEKENNGSTGVKLKIRVNNTRKPKARSDDDQDEVMNVDDDEENEQFIYKDVDEEMASLSDQESSRSSACASTSTSPSPSDDERSRSDRDSPDSNEDHLSDTSPEDSDEEEDEEDDDTERWWGFYDPLEIVRLSDWIAIKAGLDSSESLESSKDMEAPPKDLMTTLPLQFPFKKQDEVGSRASSSTGTLVGASGGTPAMMTNGNGGKKSRDTSVTMVNDNSLVSSNATTGRHKTQLKTLVDELRAFATLLEWRSKEDKHEAILRDPVAAAGGIPRGGSISGDRNGASPAPTTASNEHARADGTASAVGSVNGSAAGRLRGTGGSVKVKLKINKNQDSESTESISVESFYGTTEA